MEVLPNVNYTACATLKVGGGGAALQPRACSWSLRARAVGASLLVVTVLGILTSLCLPPTSRAQTLTMAPKVYAR